MGKDSTPTASGFYILGERFAHMIMDSSTYGVPVNSPNGYRTEVDFATQMSYSGVFVHSAPWSVALRGTPTPSDRRCRAPKALAIGTFRGISGTQVTPRRDAVRRG
jgi:hypothetical protein